MGGGGKQEQHVKDLGGGEAWRVQGAGEEGEAGREALLLFGSKAATRALLGPASRLRAARHGGIGLPQLRAISDVVGFDRLAAIAAAAAQRAAQVFSQVRPRAPWPCGRRGPAGPAGCPPGAVRAPCVSRPWPPVGRGPAGTRAIRGRGAGLAGAASLDTHAHALRYGAGGRGRRRGCTGWRRRGWGT